MNTGIIMLFSNNENEIKENQFDAFLNKNNAKICFVNNASKDNTLEMLKGINNKTTKNITILDVKKNKGLKAAIKAGARYLMNNNDISSIIYFEFYKNKDFKNLEYMLDVIFNMRKYIKRIANKESRSTLKNVYSLEELTKQQ
jgi:hypothetical protein